jgi:hypothetical protein
MKDESGDFRRAALEKVTDRKILHEIAQYQDGYSDVTMAAIERINDQRVLSHIAKNNRNADVREAAAKKQKARSDRARQAAAKRNKASTEKGDATLESGEKMRLRGKRASDKGKSSSKSSCPHCGATLFGAHVKECFKCGGRVGAPRVFSRYDGIGVCDVCNAPVGPGARAAFLVPTKVFWDSKEYRDWVSNNPVTRGMLGLQGITVDEYIAESKKRDRTKYSGVCPLCVHLFQ